MFNGLDQWRRATVQSKIHPQELAFFHVDKAAAGITRVARIKQRQLGALRQSRDIDLEHVRLRANVVQAEFAFGISGDKGAVFHVKTHIWHATLIAILNSITVAVGKHFADDEAAVAEHAG